jgi:uncharacterized C2H2 Zn-finger protein
LNRITFDKHFFGSFPTQLILTHFCAMLIFFYNVPLFIHFLVKHMGESNIKCEKCEMTFNNSSAKWRHIRIVHDGIKYSCQSCGKEYADKKRLKMHMVKHHGGGSLKESKVKSWPSSLTEPNLEHLGGHSSFTEEEPSFKPDREPRRESIVEPPTSEDMTKH